MPPVEMSLSTRRQEVLAGEPIDAAIAIHNRSAEAVAVPDPAGPVQFEFRLRTAAGELVRSIDAVVALSARTTDSFSMPARNTVELAAGQTAEYPRTLNGRGYLDVAALAPEPIAPGRYLLSAAYTGKWGEVESAGVPLDVRAPNPVGIAEAFGAFSVNRILAHSAADGSTVILQGEARLEDPKDGTWERRATLAGGSVSVSAAPPTKFGGPVWSAWLAGGAISCAMSQERSLHIIVGPQPLPIESAELYPLGLQTSRDAAVFLVLGKNAADIADASAVSRQIRIRPIQLAAAGRASHWAVRFRDAASIDVIAAEAGADGVAVITQTVSLDSAAVAPPQTLLRRPHPIAALAVDQANGAVEVLLGPTDSQHHYTYVRLLPDRNTPAAEFSFQAPLDPLGKEPYGWALEGSTQTQPPIAAMLPGRLVALRAFAEPKWQVVAETQAPRLLQLHRGKAADWAVWADAQAGIVVRAVR